MVGPWITILNHSVNWQVNLNYLSPKYLKLRDATVPDSSLIANTFTLDQLQITPHFIIFDDIAAPYLGYQNEDVLKTILENSFI